MGVVGWLWDMLFFASKLAGSHRGIRSIMRKEREAKRMLFGFNAMAWGLCSGLQIFEMQEFPTVGRQIAHHVNYA